MQAVIFTGCSESRGGHIHALPRAFRSMDDETLLSRVVRELQSAGCEELVICVGDYPGFVVSYLKDGTASGIPVRYVIDGGRLGTAGTLKKLPGLQENFVVIDMDHYDPVNIQGHWMIHVESEADMTIISFNQMTGKTMPGKNWDACEEDSDRAGIYILNRRILQYVPKDVEFELSDLLYQLSGENVRMIRSEVNQSMEVQPR